LEVVSPLRVSFPGRVLSSDTSVHKLTLLLESRFDLISITELWLLC
jgi:hypothetical protein